MAKHSFKRYSFYVSLMKRILPLGILFSLGITFGWPYFLSFTKENIVMLDMSHPEIRENRMIHPHYISTDKKGQPYHVDAEWAKQRTENLADLTKPHGLMSLLEGQSFDLKAKNGLYDTQRKTLNLDGEVILISTDGYRVKTEKAQVFLDKKIIKGNTYIEGEGPTGSIRSQNGFIVEKRPEGKTVLTLIGVSRVVIAKEAMKKNKGRNG